MIKLLYFRVVLILFSCISTISVFGQVLTVPPLAQSSCADDQNLNIEIVAREGLRVGSTCSPTAYSNRVHFRIAKIRTGGTFWFQITPVNGGLIDYDYMSWRLTPNDPMYSLFRNTDAADLTVADFNNLSATRLGDRGNRNGQSREPIGLAYNQSEVCRGVVDGLERHYDVNAGDIIIIGIDKWTSTGSYNANLNFYGTATIGCSEEFYECVDEETNLATFDLDAIGQDIRERMGYPESSPFYYYNTKEEAQQNLPENRFTSHILELPPLEDPREIHILFELPSGDLEIIEVNLITLKALGLATNPIFGCFAGANPMTGVELGTFNLREAFSEEFLNDRTASKKIYRTQANAIANGTAGLIPEAQWANHNAVEGTYWVRMEYVVAGESKCLKIVPLQLEIVKVELAEEEKNLEVCYEDVVDLTSYESYFAPQENEYEFKYFRGTTEITNPTAYEITSSRTIKVVIGLGSCLEEATININLQDTPIVEFYDPYVICDSDFDGGAELDLSLVNSFLTENMGEFTYSYYYSEDDARTETNPITTTIVNVTPEQSIWVRSANEGNCFYVAEVPLVRGDSVEYTAPTVSLEECLNADGLAIFDLTEAGTALGTANTVTSTYYPTQADAVAQTNEITNPSIWSTSEENGNVYIRLEEEGKCPTLVEVPFTTAGLPSIEIAPSYTICAGEMFTLDLSGYSNYSIVIDGATSNPNSRVFEFNQSGEYTVYVTTESGCSTDYTINLEVIPQPVFEAFEPIQICDENLDGTYEINLDAIRQEAVANVGSSFTVKLYPTEEDANAETNEITGSTLEVTTLPTRVWVRANSLGACYAISSVEVLQNPVVEFTVATTGLEVCANPVGEGVFDLTSIKPQFNVANTVNVKYYTTLENAKLDQGAIANPTAWNTALEEGTIYVRFEEEGKCAAVTEFNFTINALPVFDLAASAVICEGEVYTLDLSAYNYTFTITGGEYTQVRANVYALSSNATYTIAATVGAGCETIKTLNLVVNPKPVFTTVNTFDVCDTNLDNLYEVDMLALADVVMPNRAGVTLKFYATEANLLADRNEITDQVYLATLPSRVWVKAVNATGCFDYKSIELVVGSTITFAPATTPVTACEGTNGVNEFNLTDARQLFNVPAGYILSYYSSLADLQNDRNEILNPTVWTTTTRSGTIYVKFEAAGLCPGYSTFNYQTVANPTIVIEDKYYICNDDEFILDLSTYNNYTISVVGGPVVNLGNNRFKLSEIGLYEVEVTNATGCTSTYTFELDNFATPVVRDITVTATSIIVTIARDASYQGLVVEYSLDGINFQTSPELLIPERGVSYNVYVKIGDCIYLIHTVDTFDIPTFFSPNNDGVNDVWRIKPLVNNQEVSLKVFDRFGRILHEQVATENISWDGTFKGKKMPSTDYWYIIDIKANDVVKAIKYTGSVTLKNKD